MESKNISTKHNDVKFIADLLSESFKKSELLAKENEMLKILLKQQEEIIKKLEEILEQKNIKIQQLEELNQRYKQNNEEILYLVFKASGKNIF